MLWPLPFRLKSKVESVCDPRPVLSLAILRHRPFHARTWLGCVSNPSLVAFSFKTNKHVHAHIQLYAHSELATTLNLVPNSLMWILVIAEHTMKVVTGSVSSPSAHSLLCTEVVRVVSAHVPPESAL